MPSRPLLLFTLLAPLCLSCVEPGARAPRVAVPIKSACTASSRPASSLGIDVRQGRRHSEARTLFVKNQGDRPRRVQVTQVGRVEGQCDGEWARQTPLAFLDEDTQAAPEGRVLAPDQEIQIRMGAQAVAATWPCAKIGLALWMKVDDALVCADAGAWIATAASAEE